MVLSRFFIFSWLIWFWLRADSIGTCMSKSFQKLEINYFWKFFEKMKFLGIWKWMNRMNEVIRLSNSVILNISNVFSSLRSSLVWLAESVFSVWLWSSITSLRGDEFKLFLNKIFNLCLTFNFHQKNVWKITGKYAKYRFLIQYCQNEKYFFMYLAIQKSKT